MERRYREALTGLNEAQRKAVEKIDGPLMVIAGPGTGKTQLISTRAGYILQNTDTPPEAILMLTFTEAGVEAMRQRLTKFIGRAAYDIQLSTYHAFGGEIFRRYPDSFEGSELSLLEDLRADTLLRSIIAKLPYSDPLKFADTYLNDVKQFISEAKRALLTPEDISQIADDNLKFIADFNRRHLKDINRLDKVSKKTVMAFKDFLKLLDGASKEVLPQSVLPLVQYAKSDLRDALQYFSDSGKTNHLTRWKRQWLARDGSGNYIIDGVRLNRRLSSAGRLYGRYQQQLRSENLYDYDDMILRAISALEIDSELRYSLAEKYSYIMLDEFQDTNPAQFRLVQLLTDHPVHEGRPNVMAVGDDDQAIYAFQGADHTNMTAFMKHYSDVLAITLTENYRSSPPILQAAGNIAGQINSRLVNQISGISKDLSSSVNNHEAKSRIEAREFISDAAQYDWVATKVRQLIKDGVSPSEIAILAPKHKYLIAILPYLAEHDVPVSYEHRENILDQPLIRQLEQMSRLVVALSEGDEKLSNHLWPEILSYDFWNIPVDVIWKLSWASQTSREPWTSLLLNDDRLKGVASFFIKMASLIDIVPVELQLDGLIGVPGTANDLNLPWESPLYAHYFSMEVSSGDPQQFSRLISDLSVLRSHLNDWRRNLPQPRGLRALVEFIEGHRAAGINLLNTSPYYDKSDAVNLMTAYGAKGREFEAVFILSANDEVWGSSSRNQGYRLALPANLSYIRYQGASEDERLRLLYVAVTRARHRLYFTNYRQEFSGKPAARLKYLDISEASDKTLVGILPKKFQELICDESEYITVSAALNYWTARHLPPFKPDLKTVLLPRLRKYKLSATDLIHFIDIVHFGPEKFFMKCLLRFPSAPAVTDSFGTAIHNTLRFAGRILQSEGKLPNSKRLIEIFEAQAGRIDLPLDEQENLIRRGSDSLKAWLAQRGPDLKTVDMFEYDFQNENSRSGIMPLSGKIDRMVIDEKRRIITVVDYKTGRAYTRWQGGVVKLHLFQMQLIIYKILIESSARFRKYKVEKGIIEFVEPDENGKIQRLEYEYDISEIERVKKLLNAVWSAVQSLNFPDTSVYPATLAGIKQLEQDLADSK